ncbi:alpha/beta hydrolase [Candidatus Binatia bacterium]|nr:alpha/beta hydrolase [Candidatus Binatia bacterium]
MTFDPAAFLSEAVDPETAAFNDTVEQLIATQPPITEFAPQAIRDARESGASLYGPVVRVDSATERRIPGPAGPITLRQFIPDTVKGVCLHIHGGGFMLGAAHHHDVPLSGLAAHAEVAVVSVEYRLAPENPYPAGTDDCEAAAVWLAAHARREFGTDRLLIGGESAGANLAAATLLRMRDRHRFTGFAGAMLTFGVFDLAMTPSARRWGTRNLVINTPIMQWFSDHYVPAARRRDPDVSPLYADLANLPPAIFTIGTLDPLLDDSLFMHARWLAAGNRAELLVFPGGIHGFIAFPIAIARQANEAIVRFLRQALTPP